MRAKKLLKKGYPPDKRKKATESVLEQASFYAKTGQNQRIRTVGSVRIKTGKKSLTSKQE
jgi:hypothetical protein